MDGYAASHPDPSLRFAIVLAPLAAGFLLLFFLGWINLFWSSLFGLGGHIVEWTAPPHRSGPIDLFGLLAWPVLLLAALHWLSGWMLRLPARSRRAALLLYCLSLFIVAPFDRIDDGRSSLGRLPLYVNLWLGIVSAD